MVMLSSRVQDMAHAVGVAFTVKSNVPAVVGVPVIVPSGFNVKPVGNAPPDRLHVAFGKSISTFRLSLYGTPTSPSSSSVVVMAHSAGTHSNPFQT